ncbi:hypothetical protein CDAR_555481 [Caerostris darwini]|uniref:Uncharacterized protein n=1 Tax=Caerostris darwini TaxID=1538125 RepID=A0AAV4VWC1_9ARAC|nr:hypothetical protein CDAR_555481 [Caerostris darwini]
MIKRSTSEREEKSTFAKLITSNSRFISFQVSGLLPFKKKPPCHLRIKQRHFYLRSGFVPSPDLQGAISNKQTRTIHPTCLSMQEYFPQQRQSSGRHSLCWAKELPPSSW